MSELLAKYNRLVKLSTKWRVAIERMQPVYDAALEYRRYCDETGKYNRRGLKRPDDVPGRQDDYWKMRDLNDAIDKVLE